MALATFDVDNTLVSGQTHRRFLKFLRRKGQLGLFPYLTTGAWFLLYKIGLGGNPEHIMKYAVKFLAGWPTVKLADLASRFRTDELPRLFFPKSVELLRAHRAKGDRILLVTNLIDPLARAIASELEVSDIISTTLEEKDGIYTGRIVGGPIYGRNKLSRVLKFARAKGLALRDAWGYGDHMSDIFLLERVGHPVVVNPSWRLKQLAIHKGWKTLQFET